MAAHPLYKTSEPMATKPATAAQPLPPCDCLNDCGDDPRIDRGKARPCQVYVNHMQSKRLHDASADLLAALQALVNITHPDLDEYKAATAAISKATKGN